MMRCLLLSLVLQSADAGNYVVGFSGKGTEGWEQWDWDTLTHLAFWSTPADEVKAHARENGVKLFKANAAHLGPDDWIDSSKRADAVKQIQEELDKNDVDGTFVDYEGNLLSDKQKEDYTKYVEEIAAAIAPKEIFVCVGGRPDYEWRNYDYPGLASASSFLFIMGYDMHFYDDYTCVTKGTCSPAEAGLGDLKAGVQGYLKDVSSDKLVLGLPWYGQRYTQTLGILTNRGQVDYKDVVPILYGDKQDRKQSHTFYDNDKDMAWKLMCHDACLEDKAGGVIWYDDEQSLAPKYALAKENDLLGVGVWKLDSLDYSSTYKKYHERMWDALKSWQLAQNSTSTAMV